VHELEELYETDTASAEGGGQGQHETGEEAQHGAASQAELVAHLREELTGPGQDKPAVETGPAATGQLS
jgi:hypothetical protein